MTLFLEGSKFSYHTNAIYSIFFGCSNFLQSLNETFHERPCIIPNKIPFTQWGLLALLAALPLNHLSFKLAHDHVSCPLILSAQHTRYWSALLWNIQENVSNDLCINVIKHGRTKQPRCKHLQQVHTNSNLDISYPQRTQTNFKFLSGPQCFRCISKPLSLHHGPAYFAHFIMISLQQRSLKLCIWL